MAYGIWCGGCIYNGSCVSHRLKIISLSSRCGMFSSCGVAIPIHHNHSTVHKINAAVRQRTISSCDSDTGPGLYFRKGLWNHNWNVVKIIFALTIYFIVPIRSHIYTCHDSWAVVACAHSWPDWIIIATYIFRTFIFSAHKSFVKWIPARVEIYACLCSRLGNTIARRCDLITGYDGRN